ncbi:MAG TPA: ABC transporter ATP-binding protein [Polyangiaceae bacterium]|nr:ABC transporter ATP-binding protein [Polyangiaceae bacterium]
MSAAEPLLSVRHLVTGFVSDDRASRASLGVDDVSFDVGRGRVLAMVGQCGSGKSLTALSILRLLPPEARLLGGQLLFEGRDLATLPEPEMRRVRGRGIAMIFQEPATALSPVHTVGWQLATALVASGRVRRRPLSLDAWKLRALGAELLAKVDLPEPTRILDSFPHQLSAGMRRRVMLALALSGQPRLLIADEPTTGLDATIQAQILDLLARIARDDGMSVLLITHDLSAVAALASDVVVMYAGHVVEAAPVHSLFEQPQHPYTRLLLESSRRLASATRSATPPRSNLRPFEPNPSAACRFAEDCPERAASPRDFPRCTLEQPALEPAGARHRSRCFYPMLDPSKAHD